MTDIIRPDFKPRPVHSDNLRQPTRDLSDLLDMPALRESERARAKREFLARLDCMEAEIKSLRHMMVDLLGDDDNPEGAA